MKWRLLQNNWGTKNIDLMLWQFVLHWWHCSGKLKLFFRASFIDKLWNCICATCCKTLVSFFCTYILFFFSSFFILKTTFKHAGSVPIEKAPIVAVWPIVGAIGYWPHQVLPCITYTPFLASLTLSKCKGTFEGFEMIHTVLFCFFFFLLICKFVNL